MEKDIQMGPETVLKMSVVQGMVKIELDYAGKQMTGGMDVSIEIDQFLDLLKAAIPGTVDDVVINGLEAALKIIP